MIYLGQQRFDLTRTFKGHMLHEPLKNQILEEESSFHQPSHSFWSMAAPWHIMNALAISGHSGINTDFPSCKPQCS